MEKLTQIDIFLLTQQEKVVQSYMIDIPSSGGEIFMESKYTKKPEPSKWVKGKNHLPCSPYFEESSMSSTWQVKWDPGTRLEFRWKEATKSVSLRRTCIFIHCVKCTPRCLNLSSFCFLSINVSNFWSTNRLYCCFNNVLILANLTFDPSGGQSFSSLKNSRSLTAGIKKVWNRECHQHQP